MRRARVDLAVAERDDQVVVLLELQQLAEVLDLVLVVPVGHAHDLVAARLDARADRRAVAEVLRVVDHAHLGVLARELVRDRAAAVGRAVVDDHDLVGTAERGEQQAGLLRHGPHGPLVLVDREEQAHRFGIAGHRVRSSGACRGRTARAAGRRHETPRARMVHDALASAQVSHHARREPRRIGSRQRRAPPEGEARVQEAEDVEADRAPACPRRRGAGPRTRSAAPAWTPRRPCSRRARAPRPRCRSRRRWRAASAAARAGAPRRRPPPTAGSSAPGARPRPRLVVASSLAAVQPIGSSSASGSPELARRLASAGRGRTSSPPRSSGTPMTFTPWRIRRSEASRLEVARVRRDQHEVVAGRGQLLRERAAEARRGADDHRGHSASLAESSERKPAAGSSARRRSRNSS